jgi:hypothetical protein
MRIEFIRKAKGSWSGNCPALYREPGGYFVQCKRVTDPEVRARLIALGEANGSPLGGDEEFGWVPADVIDG